MGRMLRIGLVIDDGLDRPDGVQQAVLTLGRRLTAEGHEVHYLTSTTTRTDLEHLHVLAPHVSVKFNGNRLGTPLPARRRSVRRLMAEVPFDVLHINIPYSPVLAGRVISAAPARTAVVGSFVIYPQDVLTRWGIRALARIERRRTRRFQAMCAVSESARESVREAYHRDVPLIGNPVELPDYDDPALVAAAPGPGAAPTILFLGRLVERKGPRELVEAAAALHRTDPDRPWTLILAGRGPLLDELRERARAAGIADRVDFPGFVAEEDKLALLASADLVVLPSTGGEAFGISVVEALAVARGVVLAGDNPGYRTPMTGLEEQLVDPTDTVGFAGTLARWLADPDGRRALAGRGGPQRVAAERFDAGLITEQTLEMYHRAITARTAGR